MYQALTSLASLVHWRYLRTIHQYDQTTNLNHALCKSVCYPEIVYLNYLTKIPLKSKIQHRKFSREGQAIISVESVYVSVYLLQTTTYELLKLGTSF